MIVSKIFFYVPHVFVEHIIYLQIGLSLTLVRYPCLLLKKQKTFSAESFSAYNLFKTIKTTSNDSNIFLIQLLASVNVYLKVIKTLRVFLCLGFLSQTQTIQKTAGQVRGSSLFLSITSIHSRILRHLFAFMHLSCLPLYFESQWMQLPN